MSLKYHKVRAEIGKGFYIKCNLTYHLIQHTHNFTRNPTDKIYNLFCNVNSKNCQYHIFRRGCRGRDRMVVGFKTTCAISAYHY